MFNFLTKQLLKWTIVRKVKKGLKGSGVPVTIGKLKLVIPIKVGIGASLPLDKIEEMINDYINKYVEPKIKNVVDIEVDVRA